VAAGISHIGLTCTCSSRLGLVDRMIKQQRFCDGCSISPRTNPTPRAGAEELKPGVGTLTCWNAKPQVFWLPETGAKPQATPAKEFTTWSTAQAAQTIRDIPSSETLRTCESRESLDRSAWCLVSRCGIPSFFSSLNDTLGPADYGNTILVLLLPN
jgi:hypothetical protein